MQLSKPNQITLPRVERIKQITNIEESLFSKVPIFGFETTVGRKSPDTGKNIYIYIYLFIYLYIYLFIYLFIYLLYIYLEAK